MHITYNAPFVLSFAVLAAAVLAIDSTLGTTIGKNFFTAPTDFHLLNPFDYFRLVSHIVGHADWAHLAGNFTLILLVGPLLEEKYGTLTLLTMALATAAVTATLNMILFSTSIMGASGIVFMLIVLASCTDMQDGDIPLTFILVILLFVAQEAISALRTDNISQFAHLAGGLAGGVFGFRFARET